MTTPQPEPGKTSGPNPRASRWNGTILAVVAVVFWGLTVVFALIPTRDPIPVPERTPVTAGEIDPSPRFEPMGDDARTVISVFERQCMDCHRDLVDNTTPRVDVNHYHDTVHMDHGLNGRCVNCHDQKDRNKLVLRTGETLGFSQSTTLCANCHGPAFRQWQRGVHGKTLGYWNAELGQPQRLECVQCHNPHTPHYDPMKPLPAPNTLRMGDQSRSGAHDPHHVQSPLIRPRSHDEEHSKDTPNKDTHEKE